jgi:glycosyltransferase involved in cell wall biosynthesis
MQRILFLSRWFPFPADNGARIRISHLIKGLSSSFEVDLISFTDQKLLQEQIAEASQVCHVLNTPIYRPFKPDEFTSLAGFLSSKPRSVINTFTPEMEEAVQFAVIAHHYDVIIASEIDMGPYVQNIHGPLKILEELELTQVYDQFRGEKRLFHRWRKQMTWLKLSAYTRKLLRNFDGCTTVSENELATLHQVAPYFKRPFQAPNGVDFNWFQREHNQLEEAGSLIYPGALTYKANFEAVAYFLRDIFPRILAERPDTRFYVTGKTDGVRLDLLPNREHVIFTGYVPDIRPWLEKCQVVIVPLLSGGGTRIKILEALASGKAVVSTPKGAEGLNLIDGQHLIIAKTPEEFAFSVLRLLKDDALRSHLSENGKNQVRNFYDWEIITQSFLTYIDSFLPLGNSQPAADRLGLHV